MSFVDFWFYPITFLFLAVLAMVQFFLRKRQNTANWISKAMLLLFSAYILVCYNWRYLICIGAVIGVTYATGILLRKWESNRIWICRLSVLLLIFFLGVFKYFNFFVGSFCHLVNLDWTDINIILPIGISFYIFSAISYILDVYWGNMEAEESLLDMALFLAFFPKLVCGPILKGREFLPQLKDYRRIKWENLCVGIQIYSFGLFKKLVLADHLAVFVNAVYEKPHVYSTLTVWLAVFSYFLQLYFDFSGYSDMAIGLFKILGYDVPPNFNLPFVANNISEFWKRWHISLSSWLNEYVFNPIALRYRRKLAKLSKEKRKKYKNLPGYVALIITFLISGIWHGAGWTFVIFGLLHGVCSMFQQICANHVKIKNTRMVYSIKIVANFVLLNLIQIFFRADSVSSAFHIYQQLFTWHGGVSQPYTWTFFAYIILIIATLMAYKKSGDMEAIEAYYPVQNLATVKGLTLFFVLCGLTIMLGYFGNTYFIYGNF